MPLQFRRDTEAAIDQFKPVLKEGEPLWDLTNKKLYIGDGVSEAFELDSITGVSETDVSTVVNRLLTDGNTPNVKFVYDSVADAFNVSLDFDTPFGQQIETTAGFVGSLIGADGSTVVFEASDNAFVNLSEAFLTDIGPRNDQAFNIGSDTKRFDTAFVHNINVKDQTTIEDLTINGLIKGDDSSIIYDSRTKEFFASSIVTNEIVGDLKGSVFGDNSSLIIDGMLGEVRANTVSDNGSVLVDTSLSELSTGQLRFERNIITLTDEVFGDNEPIEIIIQTPRLRLDFDKSTPTVGGTKILTGIDENTNFLEFYTELDNDSFDPGDLLGGIAFSPVDDSGREYGQIFVGSQLDPNAPLTADYGAQKFYIIAFPDTEPSEALDTEEFRYLTFDSRGWLSVNQETAEATVDINGFMKLAILTSPPASPANGMVAIADGTGWDPLSLVGKQQMVVYLGGGWRQLSVEP